MSEPTPAPLPPPSPGARVHSMVAAQAGAGLLVLAAGVGILGGLGAVVFRHLIGLVQLVAFGTTEGALVAQGLPGWRVLIAPAVGGLLVGPMVSRWASEARGHGVPHVMRSVQLGRGIIQPRVGVVKTLASALSIGSGGSCGREGPIAQIGAVLGSVVGRLAKLPPRTHKVLVAAGAAAGIAATFNAPIAGAFFALEVVLGNFAMECFGPIVVASVSATVLSRIMLGTAPAFVLHGSIHELLHPSELLAYVLLGVLSGLLAIVFTRALVISEEVCERAPLPDWLMPAVGGLGVGALALLGLPEVLGNGAETIEALLGPGAASTPLTFLLLLLVMKLVATCISLGSGASGGVFTPSLYLGATLGALVGHLAGAVSPFPVAEPGAYALVGMAAVGAGTTHAPITLMLIVFELTNDYRIIVPLMVCASVAALVSRRLHPASIYTLKLARKGVHLNPSLEHMVMHHLVVEDVMRSHEAEVVRPEAPFSQVLSRFLRARIDQAYVVGEGGRYEGTILLQDVKGQINAATLGSETLVIAEDVARRDVPYVGPDMPLTSALEALHRSGLHELPVLVGDGEGARFEGTISEHDLLGAYNREVLRQDLLLARFVSRDPQGPEGDEVHTDYFELPEGFGLAQVPLPAGLAGRTLAELEVRKAYGLNVLAIKLRTPEGGWTKQVPEPERQLNPGDLLVVMGPLEGIEALRAGTPTQAAG